MKIAKTLGLAAVAAMALIALLGAGSASAATQLCGAQAYQQEGDMVCPEAAAYGLDLDPMDTLSATLAEDSPAEAGGGFVLTSTGKSPGSISCSSSTFTGGLNSDALAPNEEGVTSLTLGAEGGASGCSISKGACTTITSTGAQTPFNAAAEYTGLGTEGPNGVFAMANFQITLTMKKGYCSFYPQVSCVYAATDESLGLPSLKADLYNTGNANAPTGKANGKTILDFEGPVERVNSGSGTGLCPGVTGTVKATYLLSGDDAPGGHLDVVDRYVDPPTKLCSDEPEQDEGLLVCGEGDLLEGEIPLKGEKAGGSSITFGGSGPLMSCSKSSLEMSIASAFEGGGEGSLDNFTLGGGCTISGSFCTGVGAIEYVSGSVPATLSYMSAEPSQPVGMLTANDAQIKITFTDCGEAKLNNICWFEGDLGGNVYNPGVKDEHLRWAAEESQFVRVAGNNPCAVGNEPKLSSIDYDIEDEESQDVWVASGLF